MDYLVVTGIIGFISFLLFVIGIVRFLVKLITRKSKLASGLMILDGIIMFLAAGLIAVNGETNQGMIVLGIAISIVALIASLVIVIRNKYKKSVEEYHGEVHPLLRYYILDVMIVCLLIFALALLAPSNELLLRVIIVATVIVTGLTVLWQIECFVKEKRKISEYNDMNLFLSWFKELKNKKRKLIIFIICGLIFGFIVLPPKLFSGGADGNDVCKSCGRTFTNEGNLDSIRDTNMCKNCYGNFEWGKDALEGVKDFDD